MSKRGENIYKRKDGRWEGRYIKERSADGKARYAYVYGKSYADAKQKLLDRRITQAQNIDCSPSHTKYGDILRNWIAMSRIHIKESTYSRYVHLANAHILPYLGELPTGKLTTQTVEKHISFLLNKGRVDKKGGLAPKTVSDILTLIKGSIDYANCSGYSVNCYLDRLTVKKTQLDMRVLSVDEQHRLCDILMRDMNLTKFGVLLCMYTGIRIGEVCALKWESIDFSEGILSIRETLQRIQVMDVGACKKTKIVITEPKSKKAIRDIPLPGFVLEYAASLKHNPKAYILTGCSCARRVPDTFSEHSITLPPWSFRHRTDGIQFPLAEPFSVGASSSPYPMLPAEAPAPAENAAATKVCCFIPGCAFKAPATSCKSRTSSLWLAAKAMTPFLPVDIPQFTPRVAATSPVRSPL